ncbi:putative regulator of septum formation [Kutzneria buriramensis]|uniref:Putative regulator of septum formation n=2 Tax=Kutzneria buriramensis TaxID=1045776 RepID=A0A3E0HU91_9PSEU|nr:putative regulator of septum formation [Kutzneria buriramensis]
MVVMPELAEWFHPKRRTGQTRLLMVGAVVGALIVLTSSTLFSWPIHGLSATAASDDPNVAFDAPDGSCLTWPAGTANISKVDCSAKHLFEIAGTLDLTSKYPAGAPFPDGTLWQKIAQDNCGPVVSKFMGGKLDPDGKYSANALNPTAQQWSSGARTIRCGLQAAGPGGALQPTTGSAKGGDQSNIYPVGTCLGIKDKAVGDPVSCGVAHSYEIVGIVDLKSQFPDGFPADDKQQTALATRCGKAASDYTNGFDLTKAKLGLTWDTVKQESWNVGSTKVNCKVGQKLDDGSGLSPVTNSVKGVGTGVAATSTSTAPPPSG